LTGMKPIILNGPAATEKESGVLLRTKGLQAQTQPKVTPLFFCNYPHFFNYQHPLHPPYNNNSIFSM